MKIAAVIPSFYHVDGEYLKVTVESLRATTDWDIIVVTNGHKDKPDLSRIKGITLHIHTRDQGQANAVNIGVGATAPNTDYVFISNSDMYYAPDWNKHLEFRHLCQSPNLVEPTNNKGSAKPFLKCNGGYTTEEFDKNEVDSFIANRVDFKSPDAATEVGFNLPFFIQKDVWQTIGGYDTAYDPWGSNSDTDLQTKIELAGIVPMRLKKVLVYHFSNKSGTFDGTHQDFWQNNWDYYTDKWGFNRDDTNGDPWYHHNMIDYGKLRYHPDWEGVFRNGEEFTSDQSGNNEVVVIK